MYEAVTPFRPYNFILQAIQNFSCDSFPLRDYVLTDKTALECPEYLRDSPEIQIKKAKTPTITIHNGIRFMIYLIKCLLMKPFLIVHL